jgi:DNA processing protein
MDQSRDVFAVPGNITSKASWGPNLLIKQGAKLVQDWNDVVVDLPTEVRRQLIDRGKKLLLGEATPASSSGGQASLLAGPEAQTSRKLLEMLKVDASTHLDFLIEQIEGVSPSEVIAALFELEMLGLVKQLPGKNFVKVW